jgi:uncharacterized membrane protein
MRAIKLLVIIMALTPLAFAGVSGPLSVAPPPNFYINSSAVSVCKGQINYIPITVYNFGAIGSYYGEPSSKGPSMQDVQLSISNGKSLYQIQSNATEIASLAPGANATIYIPVFVAANTSAVITAPVSINYYYLVQYSDSEQKNLTFGTLLCPSSLGIQVGPKVITAGKIENITINFTNSGATSINNISLNLKFPAQYTSLLTTQPIKIATVAPYSKVSLNASLYVGQNISISVPINLTATFYNGTSLEQIANSLTLLSTGVISLSSSSLAISPAVPTSGSIFSISFVLTNTGTSSASGVTATAIVPKGFVPFGSNSVFVGTITASGQTPVTVTLTALNGTKSGTYKIPIKINYLDSLRDNLSTETNVSVVLAPSAFNTSTAAAFKKRSSGGGSLIVEGVLVVVIIVLGVLLFKERKGRHKK